MDNGGDEGGKFALSLWRCNMTTSNSWIYNSPCVQKELLDWCTCYGHCTPQQDDPKVILPIPGSSYIARTVDQNKPPRPDWMREMQLSGTWMSSRKSIIADSKIDFGRQELFC